MAFTQSCWCVEWALTYTLQTKPGSLEFDALYKIVTHEAFFAKM